MRHQGHLILFARAPILGQVKRRLARETGDVTATWAYRRLLNLVSRLLLQDPRWQSHIAVTPDLDRRPAWPWPDSASIIGQGDGYLGERMTRAALKFAPGPVVIIGTDIPDIRQHHIAAAFQALRGADAVFGPATDGGYWLVGLSRTAGFRHLFKDVRWSTDQALSDTLANLPLGTQVEFLEPLEDIDNAAALTRWLGPKNLSAN